MVLPLPWLAAKTTLLPSGDQTASLTAPAALLLDGVPKVSRVSVALCSMSIIHKSLLPFSAIRSTATRLPSGDSPTEFLLGATAPTAPASLPARSNHLSCLPVTPPAD